MKPAVIFDMDGTLADCSHRLHFVQAKGKKNWDKFFAGTKADKPKQEIVALAKLLGKTNAILIATGRPEKLRQDTQTWLKEHEVPFERMYLRGNNDFRPDGTVKAEMHALMLKDGYKPWLAIDDRDSAVKAWRALGICCLQCAESNY